MGGGGRTSKSTSASNAIPVAYETDPGRLAANVLSTAWFSSYGDVHPLSRLLVRRGSRSGRTSPPSSFRDNTFDGAAALWMLHHVADPIQALTEVRRVLAPAASSPYQRPAGETIPDSPEPSPVGDARRASTPKSREP
ncbi:methyltransferase domain-containing protein [Amycolatopsis regifaucium]|uniref:Methyltransferase type 11 domain-containing protein n=1 Tax=Amycolatopsis regifaucium TaxID=546365 RepID=A0A154MW53_9PSEU|nr:methyltransferase domain-containing protein [Amycolatopsis regifaucium]KZB88522.1 hypothetical protein AVL48_00065 [Amycolatopsis regifaucium]OKA07307.1 hypothetical protein ATP06_0215725 [Amycolatopsis regifaucium]SFI49552.1 Methyltransferase domain-containing protein [Amycolatopsis regifaucium]